MSLTETGIIPADELMIDDWMEVAGTMFRIKHITRDEMNVNLCLYCPSDSNITCHIVVKGIHPIKIFNQNG